MSPGESLAKQLNLGNHYTSTPCNANSVYSKHARMLRTADQSSFFHPTAASNLDAFLGSTNTTRSPARIHQGLLNIQQYNSVLQTLHNKPDQLASEGSKHFKSRFSSECANTVREEKMSQIGSIWNNTVKMRKNNKSYEKKTVRRLNGMIKKLNNMSDKVSEELYWGKHW